MLLLRYTSFSSIFLSASSRGSLSLSAFNTTRLNIGLGLVGGAPDGRTIRRGHKNSATTAFCISLRSSSRSQGDLVISSLLSETSRPILGAFGNDTRTAPKPGGSSVSGVSTTRTTPSNRNFLIVTGTATPIFEVTLTFAFSSLDQSTSTSRAMASSSLYVRADNKIGPFGPKSNSSSVILRTFGFLRSERALTKFSFAIEDNNLGVSESTKYCKEISPGVPITAL
mmetsp:Transcript_28226/g.45809  ORF Transcript_28226/g.45809 Transcript_28226/m.45809 type:complete len:226 (+) Transcript_28226:932-1609(+)